jgi:hypothetical protein
MFVRNLAGMQLQRNTSGSTSASCPSNHCFLRENHGTRKSKVIERVRSPSDKA